LLSDLLQHRRVALLARHDQRRIARQELLQAEDQHRHEEQGRDELQHPLGQEGEHLRLLPYVLSARVSGGRGRGPTRSVG